MQIATSYFYQIRNFKPWMIPVSTCISDPFWYRPPEGQEYFKDKRGIVNGLRYEPIIVHKGLECNCPCENKDFNNCSFLKQYKELLKNINMEKTLKAFNHCANLLNETEHEPIIVLMVYETPKNKCSERKILQEIFNCQELEYPIK